MLEQQEQGFSGNMQTSAAPLRCQVTQLVGAEGPERQTVSLSHFKAKIASIQDPAEFGTQAFVDGRIIVDATAGQVRPGEKTVPVAA